MSEEMDTQQSQKFWDDWWEQFDRQRREDQENYNRSRRIALWVFIVVRALTCFFLSLGIYRIGRAAHTFAHPVVVILLGVIATVVMQLWFNVKDLRNLRKK